MTFDPTKPVQTKDGRQARIVCTDFKDKDDYTVVVLVTQNNGLESCLRYKPNGQWIGRISGFDLVNVPEFIGQKNIGEVCKGAVRYYNTGLGYHRPTGAIGATENEWPILKVSYGPNGEVESARLLKEGEE